MAVFLLRLGIAGTERNMLTVVRHLASRGYRVDLVLINADGPLLETLPSTVRVVDLACRTKGGAVPGLARYLRRAKPDVLVSALASVNCVAAFSWWISRSKARLVLSERSTLSQEVARHWMFRILPMAMRWLYPKADAIWAVSQGVADDLAATIGLPREKIQVIYNPVLTDDLDHAAAAPIDDPWFETGAPPVILAVGRLHPQKDYPSLIKAFSKMRAAHHCRLLILGEGPERPRLEAAIQASGFADDIRLNGLTTNPFPYMRAARLFVHSARWEGLPTALIEAMASGVPVVSTDCPSGPREILRGGELAPLVPVGDVDAMAAAMAGELSRPHPVSYPLDRFRASHVLSQHEALISPPAPPPELARIALLLPNLGGGGAERVVLNLAAAFLADGHKVDLVVMQGRGELIDAVPDGARLVDLRVRLRLFALPRLVRYFREARPTAMLSNMASSNCIAWAARMLARSRTRLVLSEHSTLSVEVRRNWYRRLLPPVMSVAYPRTDGVIAVSRGVADDLSKMIGLTRERIEVVHNAVVGETLHQQAALSPEHPWMVPEGPPVLLGVGRLAEQKNFGLLLEVFAELCKERDCRLIILGEGEERQALEAQIAALGIADKVSMPGFVDNPHAFMATAEVFVLSSRWEGLPTVLIEALACGAKVVATDCPSGPREILEDGRYGRLVPSGDASALLAAVRAALDDPPPGPRDLSSYTDRAAHRRYTELLLPEHRPAGAACLKASEQLPPVQTSGGSPMPVQASEIESLLRERFPEAQIEIRDLAGDGNHYAATVIDEEFRGKNRVQQQRLVNQALASILQGSNAPLHALALQTSAPD